MRKCKRISALLLAVCLVLSMAVPAVWAEEDAEVKEVTHHFDIRKLKTDGVVSNITGNSLFNVGTTGLGDETKGIAWNYNNGKIDWKVKAYSFTTDKANDVSFTSYDYFRARASVDDWIAFTFKNPGAGKWELSLGHIVTTAGAEEMAVYILPGSVVKSDGTATEDIAAELRSAEALGTVNCYDTAGTITSDTPNGSDTTANLIKKVSTALNEWTSGDPVETPEYILVLQSVKASAAEKAYIYASSLTMTECAGDETPETPEKTSVKHRFDVRVLKTEGVITNLNGNSLFNSETTGLGKESMGTVWNYNQGNIDWKVKAYSFTTDKANDVAFTSSDYFRGRASVGDWVALTIKNPGAGKWGLSLESIVTTSGAEEMNVYILPGSVVSSDDTAVNDISKAIGKTEPVGTVNCYDTTGTITNDTPKDTDNGANKIQKVNTVLADWIAGDLAQYPEYILVFESAKENPTGTAHLYFSSLTMNYGGAAALPEEPEEKPDEEPEKENVELVKSELAYESIIPAYTPRIMATGEVNGHDYVYIAIHGSMLLVYDLDELKIVDTEKLSWSTPRSIFVDENGIVWLGGSNYNLYRYDPVSGTTKVIEIPGKEIFPDASSFNVYGLTGDGNGKLYFGTYNAGYFGMYDTVTNKFSCLSDGVLHADSQFAGYGGICLKDGYAYFCVDGNRDGDGIMTHYLVKFNLTTNKIDAYFDASLILGSTKYFTNVNVVGDTMIASTGAVLVAVDINTMTEVKIPDLEHGYFGDISLELDGKVYLMDRGENADGGRGLLEWDLEKNTMKPIGIAFQGSLNNSQCFVTIDGMPGKSMVLYKAGDAGINLIVYNPADGKTVVLENITAGIASGAGQQLRTVIGAADGKTLYVGAYGNNQLAVYDVETGERKQIFKTYSHQIEGLHFYEGKLYSGHYGQAGITMIDLEKETATPLYTLEYGAFNQHRSHTFTSGDGKVFLGTAPCLGGLGGMISWYDIEAERIYVAAGPEAEDVYYTAAGLLDQEGKAIKQVWYNALTNEKMDFDEDGDGTDDSHIIVDGQSVQRFHGVIEDQTPICLIYKDGYIYGCTSRAGGSGSDNTGVGNACLFVYDVNTMKLVASLDISKMIDGLTTPVEFIDVIAEDPDVPGKFWGVVSDTLFSFTFDMEKKAFNVKEELSLGKAKYSHGNNSWQSRDIIFDGNFMYVVFGSNGTYLINRKDVSVYYQISAVVPKKMVLAADRNLYFLNKDNDTDLQMLRIAETVQKIMDPYEIPEVQVMIDALHDAANITLEDEPSVLAARAAYDRLSETGKAQINAGKLTAAETVIASLRGAADKAAAEAVINQIAAIGTVTLKSENAIEIARASYKELTAAQKVLVTNLDVLEMAENSLAALKEAMENPKTGDGIPVVMLTSMVLISATALVTVGYFKRKKV